VQRSYYQPVTTYQCVTEQVPVTTYRTSYFYEPVTTCRTSCYYDPCTCRTVQVQTPVTSYRLRSQCCPVTCYMQRTALKPVQSYQLAYYWEPQTTCCQTTIGAPIYPSCANGTPSVTDSFGTAPRVPSVSDSGSTPPPTVRDSQKPTDPPPMFKINENSYRQPQLGPPQFLPPSSTPTPEPARVRIDKIASLTRHNVDGEVLGANRVPRSNAKVLFVSADRKGVEEEVSADGAGRFRTSLAAGNWLVYTHGADGRPVFHRKLEVRFDEAATLSLEAR
jgi:hypothetical protein